MERSENIGGHPLEGKVGRGILMKFRILHEFIPLFGETGGASGTVMFDITVHSGPEEPLLDLRVGFVKAKMSSKDIVMEGMKYLGTKCLGKGQFVEEV